MVERIEPAPQRVTGMERLKGGAMWALGGLAVAEFMNFIFAAPLDAQHPIFDAAVMVASSPIGVMRANVPTEVS